MYLEQQSVRHLNAGWSDSKLIHQWVRRKPPQYRRSYWLLAKQFQSFIGKPLALVSLTDVQAFGRDQYNRGLGSKNVSYNLACVKSLITFGYHTGALPVNITPQQWASIRVKHPVSPVRTRQKLRWQLVVSMGFFAVFLPAVLASFIPAKRVLNLMKDWEKPQISAQLIGLYQETSVVGNINVKAFLDTIAWGEGTAGPNGYKTLFAGQKFSDYSTHPDRLECAPSNGRQLCSSAAGRYQILKPTFDRLQDKLGLTDFSPRSQDLAAVELIREQGALEDIEAGKIRDALEKVSAIWVHIEGAGYGQPEHSFAKLEEMFWKQRQKYE